METKAVISLAGKQFFVKEGDEIKVDKHFVEAEKKLDVKDVLLTVAGDDIKVGAPFVSGALVSLEITSQGKAPKVVTARYKAKSRSRRTVGHRQPQTILKVVKVA